MKPKDREAILASMTAEERAEVETNLEAQRAFRGVAKELPWKERLGAYLIAWVAGRLAEKAVEEAARRKLLERRVLALLLPRIRAAPRHLRVVKD